MLVKMQNSLLKYLPFVRESLFGRSFLLLEFSLILHLVCRLKELQTAFNSNIKSRIDVQVAVNDFFAQKAFDVYRGFIQIYTIKRRDHRPAPQQLDIAIPALLRQQVFHSFTQSNAILCSKIIFLHSVS